MIVTTIGLDIAKSILQIHGVDSEGPHEVDAGVVEKVSIA